MKALALYKKYRGKYRRLMRLMFSSPAEVRFIRLMGGKVWTFDGIRSRHNGFPLTIVVSMGSILRAEHFKREVRYGIYFVDFANDLNRVIEIDGSQHDVVADMERDIYIKNFVWNWSRKREARIMRIPAFKLTLDAQRVQSQVLEFIKNGKY